MTILLTTHDLEDVERLCSRVMVINHGNLLYDGTMAELRHRCPADSSVTIDIDGEPILPDSLRSVKREGSRVSFHFSRHMGEGELLAKVISQNHVRDISITEPPIEEVVRDLYEGGENA